MRPITQIEEKDCLVNPSSPLLSISGRALRPEKNYVGRKRLNPADNRGLTLSSEMGEIRKEAPTEGVFSVSDAVASPILHQTPDL